MDARPHIAALVVRSTDAVTADYRVRSAVAADLVYVPELERAAAIAFEPWGLAQAFAAETIDSRELELAIVEQRLLIAAEDNDIPVGFAFITTVEGQPHLEELDVAPEHGRRGIGSRLVEAVCVAAKAQGSTRVTLSTMRDVPFNAPFYARLGFEVIEEEAATSGLRALRDDERARGLDVLPRVLMMRRLDLD
ncbi:MAG: GNAT superfamily N-acetyltransferase [Hyphomicrobiaceae bacterium]